MNLLEEIKRGRERTHDNIPSESSAMISMSSCLESTKHTEW